jgi:hypothetical protein
LVPKQSSFPEHWITAAQATKAATHTVSAMEASKSAIRLTS